MRFAVKRIPPTVELDSKSDNVEVKYEARRHIGMNLLKLIKTQGL